MQTETAGSPPTTTTPTGRNKGSALRVIVQAETNLLRFPFFALHTKGLRDVDYKEVRGTRVENGKTHEFVFRVSRNTDHFYPGPLSRKVHFALLSLLRKQGFPFRNSISFTWRHILREMQVTYGGSTSIQRLKDALLSTLGAMIKSSYALKCGESRETLPSRERGYALYTECSFTNDILPDGTVADRNYVTLADWYLANLNSLYAAPIDYPLWNRLNDRSPLASRLYEFLLFNFSTGIDTFTINYAKLCQFLPAKVEQYASLAKKQLNPAFGLLADVEIIGGMEWTLGRGKELQIQVTRGGGLTGVSGPTRPANILEPDLFETVTTTVGANAVSPAERLVQQFHAAWSGKDVKQVSGGELDAAKDCLETYGLDRALQLLPTLVQRMKQQFPDAKTFGATRSYFQEVHEEQLKRQRIAEKVKDAVLAETTAADERHARDAELEAVWQTLDSAEQQAIQDTVHTQNSRLKLEKFAGLLHGLCLLELDRRRKVAASRLETPSHMTMQEIRE